MQHESDILAACRKQDRRAQEVLFKLYSGYMLGICMRYTGNAEDARDLLHDGFIKAFDSIRKFRGDCSIKTWLSALFVNLCISHLRKRNKRLFSELAEADVPDEETFSEAGENQDILDRLSAEQAMEMVQSLPDRYRVIINLYSIEGFTHKEIAEQLQISEGTSKSQLSRARKLLMSMTGTPIQNYHEQVQA